MHGAAKYGHLEVLKWAREHNCPWGGRTRKYAAKRGHIELLRWAEENGCPPPPVEEGADDSSETEDLQDD